MTPESYEFLAEIVREKSGLALTPEKGYLLKTRLMPVSRKYGVNDLDELVAKVRNGGGQALVGEIVEAMTTNETFFFRDQRPFELMRDTVLPRLGEARKSRRALRIWCAACSTGQEPYSIAMLIKEAGKLFEGWNIEIVATDLSSEVLDKAKVGLYSQFEVQRGLPVQMLVKYFKQVRETWQVDSALRAMVTFKTFNLLGSMMLLGKFDIIFCRNVLIYFDAPTKGKVLGEMRKIIENDGSLFLGGSETVLGITDKFRPTPDARGVYEPL